MGLAGIVAVSDDVFDVAVFLLALIGTLLLQSAANLINEYMDFRRGADQLKEAGQGMTIKKKILTPESVRNGAIITTLARLPDRLIPARAEWPLALDYWHRRRCWSPSAIRRVHSPWHTMGLGEISVAIFMGPAIVVGAYYVMFPAVARKPHRGARSYLLADCLDGRSNFARQ